MCLWGRQKCFLGNLFFPLGILIRPEVTDTGNLLAWKFFYSQYKQVPSCTHLYINMCLGQSVKWVSTGEQVIQWRLEHTRLLSRLPLLCFWTITNAFQQCCQQSSDRVLNSREWMRYAKWSIITLLTSFSFQLTVSGGASTAWNSGPFVAHYANDKTNLLHYT